MFTTMQHTASTAQKGLTRSTSQTVTFGIGKKSVSVPLKARARKVLQGKSLTCFVADVDKPSSVTTTEGTPISEFIGSTPSIEQTVRSFARDLTKSKYTLRLFAADVEYKDDFRSFKGLSKYSRATWVSSNIVKPQVTVTGVAMQDKNVAVINWRVSGTLGGQAVVIKLVTTIEMNLLTGRITKHSESWDLSDCDIRAATAARASRAMWSARQAVQDTTESMSQSMDSFNGSLDEDGPDINFNPNDPNRFFQNQENPMKDYLTLTTVIAFMYFIYHAYAAIEKLP